MFIPGTLTSHLAIQKPSNKRNDEIQVYFKHPNQIVLHFYILYEASRFAPLMSYLFKM